MTRRRDRRRITGSSRQAGLIRLEGAATVARGALVFFAVVYTAWEVIVGLSTGLLTDYANGLPAAEQTAVAGAIQDFNEHWVTQVALLIGFSGWVVAMVATAIAARGEELAGRRSARRDRGSVCDSPAANRSNRLRVLRRRRTTHRARARPITPIARESKERPASRCDRPSPSPRVGGTTGVASPVSVRVRRTRLFPERESARGGASAVCCQRRQRAEQN